MSLSVELIPQEQHKAVLHEILKKKLHLQYGCAEPTFKSLINGTNYFALKGLCVAKGKRLCGWAVIIDKGLSTELWAYVDTGYRKRGIGSQLVKAVASTVDKITTFGVDLSDSKKNFWAKQDIYWEPR